MGSSLEWHFPFFYFCAWKPSEDSLSVFSFLFSSTSSFFSPLWFFLFLHVIYACLHTVSIKSLPLVFFPPPSFCHCNLYQQSRCLNNANPSLPPISSFNHMYSFSTLAATIVCRHSGIHGNLGTKSTNPLCLVVMPDSNTKSHNSTITQKHRDTHTHPDVL